MSSQLKLTFKIKFDIFLDLHSFLAYCWGKFIYPFIRDYVNFYTSVRGTFCCKTNIKKQHKLILFYCRVVARSIRNLCHRDAIPAWAVCNAKSLSALPATQAPYRNAFRIFLLRQYFFHWFFAKIALRPRVRIVNAAAAISLMIVNGRTVCVTRVGFAAHFRAELQQRKSTSPWFSNAVAACLVQEQSIVSAQFTPVTSGGIVNFDC